MNKNQRQMFTRLMNVTNDLGGILDRTSTAGIKFIERQEALGKVSKIIYGIMCDHPENDNREDDLKRSNELLSELEALAKKTYPDRNGYLREYESR